MLMALRGAYVPPQPQGCGTHRWPCTLAQVKTIEESEHETFTRRAACRLGDGRQPAKAHSLPAAV